MDQVRVTFADEIGNTKVITGTGFWISDGDDYYFFTNAHNVNPKFKLQNDPEYRLYKVEIRLRRVLNEDFTNESEFCQIDLSSGIEHPSADVAAFVNPHFTDRPNDCRFASLSSDILASASFFQNRLQILDVASFIGYPGVTGKPWYDRDWNLPIARVVDIASFPKVAFTNDLIGTSDTLLVSGLSFSGSSGSPVVTHEKGGSRYTTTPDYTPPTLIGIMSGHWQEPQDNHFAHSGLSYLTRSTSILEMIEGVRRLRATKVAQANANNPRGLQ